MGEIINLRMARKRARRQQAEERAQANRIVHGRSKVERDLEAARAEKADRDLEAHKIETGDGR